MIVVPSIHANDDLLDRCLTSIDDYTPAGVQVIVADHPDHTFAENCNAGVAADPNGPYVVFLNDDTEVTDGWYENLVAPFHDPTVNVVGCRLVYPDGSLQHAGVYLDFQAGILTAHNYQTEQVVGPVEAVTGACMAVRRTYAWFDEKFRNGYEDVDLCLRVGGVWYTDQATVIHHESRSGPRRWEAVTDNIELLHYRWGDELHRRAGTHPR